MPSQSYVIDMESDDYPDMQASLGIVGPFATREDAYAALTAAGWELREQNPEQWWYSPDEWILRPRVKNGARASDGLADVLLLTDPHDFIGDQPRNPPAARSSTTDELPRGAR